MLIKFFDSAQYIVILAIILWSAIGIVLPLKIRIVTMFLISLLIFSQIGLAVLSWHDSFIYILYSIFSGLKKE